MQIALQRCGTWLLAWLVMVVALVQAADTPPELPGLVVEDVVADSPAAKAGLKVGDRLLTYDDKPLPSPAALSAAQQNTRDKKEVALRLQRGNETLTLTVPLGTLGIEVRPDLPPAAMMLYAEGRAAQQAQKTNEAIANWTAAAKAAQEAGDKTAAAWVYGRVGGIYEGQRQWKEAQEAYVEAWELLKQSSDAAAQSRTLVALGRCSQNLNDFPQAQQWYEQAWQVDAAASNEMWAAADLNDLGNVTWSRGDLSAAQDYHTRALAIRERLAPNSLEVAASLNNLGAVAADRGDLSASQDYHTRALAIRERLAPNSLDAAASLNNLGVVARYRGDLSASQDYHTRALAIYERLAPNSLDVAMSLNNLGVAVRARGELQAAHDYYSRALAIFERLAPNSQPLAASLSNLGNIAHERGDLVSAQDYHTRALTIFERLAPNSLEVAASLNNLGTVAHDRGDLQAARDYFRRALAIYERLAPNSLSVATSLNNLGEVASQRGDLQAAHDYHIRSLAIREQLAPNSLDVAYSLNNLGNVAQTRGDLVSAQDYHTRALAIYERLAPNSLGVAYCLNNLGSVAGLRGDLQAAHDYSTSALAIKERLAPDSLDVAASLNNLGFLALAEGRFSDARALFTRAVEIVEAQRRQIPSTEARALLVAHQATKYRGLLRTDLTLNDQSAAFATLERAHARSLVELLSERQLDFRADAPADFLKQQNELDQKRSNAYTALTKLDPKKDGEQIEKLRTELYSLVLKQRSLTAKIQRASPKFAALQYPDPLDTKGAQAALDAGTLLLAYYVDAKQTYLFAVTKNDLKVFTLSIGEEALEEQVREFWEMVAKKRLGNPTERGQQLYDTLIRPAQAKVSQAQRILLCPDGPLHTLPFAALVSQTKPTLRYFSTDKPLHTIVSMTVYAETRKWATERDVKRETKLLAFGDPIYTKEQAFAAKEQKPMLIAQGRGAEGKESNVGDSEVAYLRRRGLKLEPLPLTRKEVEYIAKLFGKSATTLLGQAATETAAKQESKGADIVHFACHGRLDELQGLSSGLVLSQPEALGWEPTKDDNGLLQAWEILEQVRLKADLVVLSACQTGLGQEVRGEGLIGLTRAFLYAGAKSVVVSLWEVKDDSTAELMKAFYLQLRKGTSKDGALQKAQAAVRRKEKWQHPFYWASFTLVGDWQ